MMKCPKCECEKIHKNGFTKANKQRYRCSECGASFVLEEEPNSINITPALRKKLIDSLMNDKMPAVADIKLTSKIKKSDNTIYYWRHKVLNELIKFQDEVVLEGQIQVDETYFSVSYKGNHNKSSFSLPRKARKRSSDIHTRGLSKEKVSVLTAIDERGISYAVPICVGRPTSQKVYDALKNHIKEGSILITDGAACYRKLAKSLNLNLIQIPSGKYATIVNGVKYHINTINSYHSRLKRFISKFHGVSSKFLTEYVAWFSFLDRKDLTIDGKKSVLQSIIQGDLKPVREINKLDPININKPVRKKKAKS